MQDALTAGHGFGTGIGSRERALAETQAAPRNDDGDENKSIDHKARIVPKIAPFRHCHYYLRMAGHMAGRRLLRGINYNLLNVNMAWAGEAPDDGLGDVSGT